jgi:hypothetical protein
MVPKYARDGRETEIKKLWGEARSRQKNISVSFFCLFFGGTV